MSAKAIIFDCDGVLMNSEAIYISTEVALLAEIGLTYEPTDYQSRFVGLSNRDFVAALQADCAMRGLGPFPDDFDARRAAECQRRFATELRAVDGLARFLEGMRGPRAVASSSLPDSLARKLAMTGLTGHFAPHVYSSAQVRRGKPAPDLFLMAAERIGAAPQDCIAIEDSANGVIAGCAAGMEVWGFTGGGHADAGLAGRLEGAGADSVFGHFDQVAARYRAST